MSPVNQLSQDRSEALAPSPSAKQQLADIVAFLSEEQARIFCDGISDVLCGALARTAASADSDAITPRTPLADLPEYLTVAQASKFLRLSRNTIYDAVHSGQLPSRRFAGRQFRIPREALLAFRTEVK
jgi:excisionase family DNA binding protein